MLLALSSVQNSNKEEVFSYLERILIEWIPHELISIPTDVSKRLCEIIVGKWIQFLETEIQMMTFNLNLNDSIDYLMSRESKITQYYDIIEFELIKPEILQIQDSYVWNQLQLIQKTMIEFKINCSNMIKALECFLKFRGSMHDCILYPEIMGLLYTCNSELNLSTPQTELLFHILTWSIRQECLELYVKGMNLSNFTTRSAYQVLHSFQCFLEVFHRFDELDAFHSAVTRNNSAYLLKEVNQSLLFMNDIVYVCKAADSCSFDEIQSKIDSFSGSLLENSLVNLKAQFLICFGELGKLSNLLFVSIYENWRANFVIFKLKWVVIEQNIIGVINQCLESTDSIERRISILTLFRSYRLSEKCVLFLDIQKKSAYDLICFRLRNLRKSFDLRKLEPEIPIGQFKYCGSANWALRYMDQTKYLELLVKSINLLDLQEIESFKQHIRVYVSDTFQMWKSTLADDMDLYLKYPILDLDSKNSMTANLDLKFQNAINEGIAWKKIGFELPDRFQFYISNFSEIVQAYDKVNDICLKYNGILEQAGTDFECLFTPLKKEVLNSCQKGLYDLTWNNLLEVFTFCKNSSFSLVNLSQICTKSRKFLTSFAKRVETIKLYGIMEKVTAPADGVIVEEFIQLLNDELQQLIQQFKAIFKETETLRSNLQKTLRYFTEEIWSNVKKELNKAIYNTLLQLETNICKELILLLSKDASDQNEDNLQLLLTVKLDSSNKMTILPPENVIIEQFVTFSKVCHDELGRLMGECKNIQSKTPVHLTHNISEYYASCEFSLDVYNQFKDIYELNKDAYVRRFNKQNPSIDAFDAEIQRYYEFMVQINSKIETIQSVNLFSLNHQDSKQSIVLHCVQWQVSSLINLG
eukprot:NODE_259_length_12613_cov_0.311411.p2 type:complete len:868 gc:universal NODE_259_length_12613_cov_0.311411:4012-6615(+)